MPDQLPIHDELEEIDRRTIFKTNSWWKAVVLYEGFGRRDIGVYLWKRVDDGWTRQQKYVVRSQDDWEEDRRAIEELL